MKKLKINAGLALHHGYQELQEVRETLLMLPFRALQYLAYLLIPLSSLLVLFGLWSPTLQSIVNNFVGSGSFYVLIYEGFIWSHTIGAQND